MSSTYKPACTQTSCWGSGCGEGWPVPLLSSSSMQSLTTTGTFVMCIFTRVVSSTENTGRGGEGRGGESEEGGRGCVGCIYSMSCHSNYSSPRDPTLLTHTLDHTPNSTGVCGSCLVGQSATPLGLAGPGQLYRAHPGTGRASTRQTH